MTVAVSVPVAPESSVTRRADGVRPEGSSSERHRRATGLVGAVVVQIPIPSDDRAIGIGRSGTVEKDTGPFVDRIGPSGLGDGRIARWCSQTRGDELDVVDIGVFPGAAHIGPKADLEPIGQVAGVDSDRFAVPDVLLIDVPPQTRDLSPRGTVGGEIECQVLARVEPAFDEPVKAEFRAAVGRHVDSAGHGERGVGRPAIDFGRATADGGTLCRREPVVLAILDPEAVPLAVFEAVGEESDGIELVAEIEIPQTVTGVKRDRVGAIAARCRLRVALGHDLPGSGSRPLQGPQRRSRPRRLWM